MRILVILFLFLTPLFCHSQNWDYIKSSGEYYYGESVASTEAEADKEALAQLVSMIAVHVSSDFTQHYEHNGNGTELSKHSINYTL